MYNRAYVSLFSQKAIDCNIYCFWTGDNQMSRARQAAFKVLQKKSGCNVTLVTPQNLETFIKPEYPLHEGYKLLSLTHKSDYLRSYFMYHYGGGYTDIKPYPFNWHYYFIKLSKRDVDFIGARELYQSDVASSSELVRKNFNKLSSCCYFIFKRHTVFASEWHKRVNAKMDEVMDKLELQNGLFHPRAIIGGIHNQPSDDHSIYPQNYPLRWTELHGDILHQLQFENIDSHVYDLILPVYRLSNKKFR